MAHVFAVDQHTAAGRIVEARDQIGQRALACAGASDQRDPIAAFNAQIDAFNDLAPGRTLTRRITELDPFELDRTALHIERTRQRMVDNLRFDVEEVKDSLDRGGRGRHDD